MKSKATKPESKPKPEETESKHEYVLAPHLTHRPFEDLEMLLRIHNIDYYTSTGRD